MATVTTTLHEMTHIRTVQTTRHEPAAPPAQHQGATGTGDSFVQGSRQGVDAGLIPKPTPEQLKFQYGNIPETYEQLARMNGWSEAPPQPTAVQLPAVGGPAASPAPAAPACPAPPAPAPCAPTAARPKRTKAQNDAEFARNWKTFHKNPKLLKKNDWNYMKGFVDGQKASNASVNQAAGGGPVRRAAGGALDGLTKAAAAEVCKAASLKGREAQLEARTEREWNGITNPETLKRSGITPEDIVALQTRARELALASVGGNENHPGFGEAMYMANAAVIGDECNARLHDKGLPLDLDTTLALRDISQNCTDYCRDRSELISLRGKSERPQAVTGYVRDRAEYLKLSIPSTQPPVAPELLRLAQTTLG